MSYELIRKLQYSYEGQQEKKLLPPVLSDSYKLVSEYFKDKINNKLCLVFPSRDYAAQWLSFPLILELVKNDYIEFADEIYNAGKRYKRGDNLILNDDAIVEWVGWDETGISFKTKPEKNASGAIIKIKYENIIKLKPAPKSRNALSTFKRVRDAFYTKRDIPLDILLNINTQGNNQFFKNSICLITKYKSYDESIGDLQINDAKVSDYFSYGKIDESGKTNENRPLLVSNNFSNLILYLTESKPVSCILIDGFNSITPRGDFSDIDREFKIPTILITDLSEIENFPEIKNCGFDFFSFNKDNIEIQKSNNGSPFKNFESKLNIYSSFCLKKEICYDKYLEDISKKLHALPKDEADENLNILKVSLISLSNLLSRICYVPTEIEIANFNQRISDIEVHILNCYLWLGEARKPVDEVISLLKQFVQQLIYEKTEKCKKMESLIENNYDYIICPSEIEANTLKKHLFIPSTKVISVADLNDELLTSNGMTAIITGWPKSANMCKIISSFLFSELTVLFYEFENRYYNSLQKRNLICNENIQQTVSKEGVHLLAIESKSKGFEDLFSYTEISKANEEISIDIVEFELKLDDTQFSKYSGKDNLTESCKAKRIEFENDTFLYATETHKFLVINELIESIKKHPNIHSRKHEMLQTGDIIAFINTDRDVLVELVEKTVKSSELAGVKKWTDLWKNLLREYFLSIGSDFKKLVEELKKNECNKHPVTIKTWLQDDNRIGPDDDADLISIAMLTQSETLNDNIDTVRRAISQMTSWRMRASDLVRDKIKDKLSVIAKSSIINSSIEIPDLGRVEILKVSELKKETEEIDKKFVHRLIAKEII